MKELKGTETEKNLAAAYSGEAQALVKYLYYAKKARQEGYEKLADYFEETARNEDQHAKLWFEFLHGGSIPTTADNLMDAIKGENYEHTIMYKEFTETAEKEGFKQIAMLFEEVGKIESDHEDRYQKLLNNVENGTEFAKDEEEIWICAKCGHKHVGKEAPAACKVCKHPQAYFSLLCEKF